MKLINKKLVVGIDINEVLRAQWIKFDNLYEQEFGTIGIPEEPYVFDYFNTYKWEDVVEKTKVLKEPEDIPENINPIEYQIDENGNAPADAFLFTNESAKLTAKEVYNRFMYEDFVFELFARAPQMYRGLDLHVQQFCKKYSNFVDFVVVSKENWFSTPSTLSFLATMLSRFKNIRFVDESIEKWDGVDILITADPEILKNDVPKGKHIIKVSRPFNEEYNTELSTLQIAGLLENDKFQNLIGYVETKELTEEEIRRRNVIKGWEALNVVPEDKNQTSLLEDLFPEKEKGNGK